MMPDGAARLWAQAAAGWAELRERIAFGPALADLPAWLAPVSALAALLALALLAGIALAALSTLVATLLTAHLLLTQVFGIRVELAVPR